jgi:hypothetical protein
MNAAEIIDLFDSLYRETYNFPAGLASPFDREGAAVLAQVDDGANAVAVTARWPGFMLHLTSRSMLAWAPPRPSLGFIAAHHSQALAYLRQEGVPVDTARRGPTIDTSGIVVLSENAVRVA